MPSRVLPLCCLVVALASRPVAVCFAQCRFPAPGGGRLLTYTFEPGITAGKTVLHMTLTWKALHAGAESIEVPSQWAGETLRGIGNLRALSRGATIADDGSAGERTVQYPPKHYIVIAWDMANDWTGPFRHPMQFHGVIMPEYLEINGANALVHPKLDSRTPVTVRFDWRKLPANWVLATSFGAGSGAADRCQSYSGPWEAVTEALFAAGDFRLRPFHIGTQPAVLAIRGKWIFTDEQPISDIQSAVSVVRDFWHDHNFPYYLVTLKPYDQDHGNSDGSQFTNAFWLYLSRLDPLSTQIWIPAHEAFHAWNPHRMGILPADDAPITWFSEGFTRYYGFRLVDRAGLMPLSAYVEWVNRDLRQYPASDDPGVRGHIIALWLDAQIRTESGGKSSLDNVMRDMLRGADLLLTTDRVLETAGRYLSPDARLRLDQAVRQGPQVFAQDDALGPCAHVTVAEQPSFDLGFDFDASTAAHSVIGLRPGGPAFQAGLRDGQRLAGWSVYNDQPDKIATLTIQTDTGRQTIEYYPKGKTITLQQYHIDPQAYSRDPAACRLPVLPSH